MPKGIYKRTEEHISQNIKNLNHFSWKDKKRPSFSREWKKNMGKSHIGFKHSEGAKRKMSIAHKLIGTPWLVDRRQPQETIEKRK